MTRELSPRPGAALRARYERTLEMSPALLDRLQQASASELSLRDEVALARTLLDEVLASVAAAHGRTGKLSADGLGLLMEQLNQVHRLVESAASIEAKRGDQALSATHVLLLVTALRDDLRRSLTAAFGDGAAELVDDAFRRQRWTGGLDPAAVAEALAAPAAYEVKFRPLEREGGDGPVRERRDAIPADGLLDALAGAPAGDPALAAEAEAADRAASGGEPDPLNGRGGRA